jgi:3',5'-cyclic AMP phosphodiesterase CpdA
MFMPKPTGVLAQISDTHLLPVATGGARARERADNLERTIKALNKLKPRPLALVHTGDMVNFGADNDYGLAREILSSLAMPFYPAIGNRDGRRALMRAFLRGRGDLMGLDMEGFCQYRAALEGFDLVAIDTRSQRSNIGSSCPARVGQARRLLDMDAARPVFVFMHHPPAPVKELRNPLQFESPRHARAFADLFDEYDNIVRILVGHTHRSDMISIGRHMASSQLSLAPDLRLASHKAHHTGEPVFQLHRLEENGEVSSSSHMVRSGK